MIRFLIAAALLATTLGSAEARHHHRHRHVWTATNAQAVPLPRPRIEPRITPEQGRALAKASGLDDAVWNYALHQCWDDWEKRRWTE